MLGFTTAEDAGRWDAYLAATIPGNLDLGMLANVEKIPSQKEVDEFIDSNIEIRSIISGGERKDLEVRAQEYLRNNDVQSALKTLLAP